MQWQPMNTAPRDGTEILYADANGYVGLTYWTKCYRPGGDLMQWFEYDQYGEVPRGFDEDGPCRPRQVDA